MHYTEEGQNRGMTPLPNMITYVAGVFDFDLDGDLDIIMVNDRCLKVLFTDEKFSWIRILENDGDGYFTDVGRAGTMDGFNSGVCATLKERK